MRRHPTERGGILQRFVERERNERCRLREQRVDGGWLFDELRVQWNEAFELPGTGFRREGSIRVEPQATVADLVTNSSERVELRSEGGSRDLDLQRVRAARGSGARLGHHGVVVGA